MAHLFTVKFSSLLMADAFLLYAHEEELPIRMNPPCDPTTALFEVRITRPREFLTMWDRDIISRGRVI